MVRKEEREREDRRRKVERVREEEMEREDRRRKVERVREEERERGRAGGGR